MRAAFVGDLERLTRTLARSLLDQAHVLKQRKGRINHAWARRIFAAGHILDRADQIVAGARLVGDQLQQHKTKFAGFKHPPPSPSTPAGTLWAIAEIEVERSPAAPAAHREQRLGPIELDPSARAATMIMSMGH